MNDNNTKPYLTDFSNLLATTYTTWQTIDITHFEKQKLELDTHRPFPPLALKSLEEKLEVDEVHNSTAIEGNSLTLGETDIVLNKGLTVAGKPLKDHLEVKSYDKAYQYVRTLIADTVTENLILEIHRLVFADFTDDLKKQFNHGIGKYRHEAVYIRGSSFVPPNYLKIPDLMKLLIMYLNEIKNDPIRKAILTHLGLVTVHPFIDGNGRCARLLMDLMIFQAGYPIIIVKKERRSDYLNVLESVQNNPKDTAFFRLMLQFLQESFDLYKSLYS